MSIAEQIEREILSRASGVHVRTHHWEPKPYTVKQFRQVVTREAGHSKAPKGQDRERMLKLLAKCPMSGPEMREALHLTRHVCNGLTRRGLEDGSIALCGERKNGMASVYRLAAK